MSLLAVSRSSLSTSLLRYSRSWGLWLLLLIAPVAARFWIPGENDTSSVITVNNHAPVLSSAMLGVSLGIVTATLLLPVAFIYLRANTTRRQPWQVEEVSVASRVGIAFGRFLADAAILGAVLLAMTIAGWFIAWLLTPIETVRPADVAIGLWLIAAPALLGVAALRNLFDSFPLSRGPLGDVLFFFVWMATLIVPAVGAERNVSFAGNMLDFAGFVRPLSYSLPEGQKNNFTIGATPMQEGRIELDVMSGLMSEGYVASRFAWAGIALLIAAFAGLVYRPHRPRRKSRGPGLFARALAPGRPPPPQLDAPPAGPSAAPWFNLFVTELRLIAEGRLWLILAAGIVAASIVFDFRSVASPMALLLLIFGLTAHAGRSETKGLLALTGVAPLSPMARRLAFVLAGTFWSLALVSPAIVRAAAAGNAQAALLALVTGLATALAAIVLAALSRSAFAPRLVLLIAWYAYLSAA